MNTKQEKLALLSCICHNWTKFSSLHILMSFLTCMSAQNVQSEHFECAKELASRKSGERKFKVKVKVKVI